MDIIEEYMKMEERIKRKQILYSSVTRDIIELHEQYPYITIDDLLEIYQVGMNRTLKEVLGEE